MRSSRTHLQVFRQERHPLVALVLLAFTMRLCLVILATALLPDAAGAAGLTSLCQSTSDRDFPQAHNAALCQCGPVCVHACALGPCLAGKEFAPLRTADLSSPARFAAAPSVFLSGDHHFSAIRAPPRSLI